MLRAITVIVVIAAALGATTVQARPVASTPTRVTLIGDSIATAIEFEAEARTILAKGIDLDLEVAPCRRIVGDSCPYQGKKPPTLIELLPSLRLGSTVVVATGYNDYEDTFPATIEAALTALRGAGIEHVLWVTLRAERQSYLRMNELIRGAAKRHPEMTIVDWNLYSRSHPDWFQEDGLHLGRDGAIGLATLVHRQLDDLGLVAAPTPRALAIATTSLPVGQVGRSYSTRLRTNGGSAPIRWAKAQGTMPAGLTLKPRGMLVGTPRTAGRRSLLLRATDSRGRSATRRLRITVTP